MVRPPRTPSLCHLINTYPNLVKLEEKSVSLLAYRQISDAIYTYIGHLTPHGWPCDQYFLLPHCNVLVRFYNGEFKRQRLRFLCQRHSDEIHVIKRGIGVTDVGTNNARHGYHNLSGSNFSSCYKLNQSTMFFSQPFRVKGTVYSSYYSIIISIYTCSIKQTIMVHCCSTLWENKY